MQKRRNSSASAMELRLFCIKPLISYIGIYVETLYSGTVLEVSLDKLWAHGNKLSSQALE